MLVVPVAWGLSRRPAMLVVDGSSDVSGQLYLLSHHSKVFTLALWAPGSPKPGARAGVREEGGMPV